MDRTLEIQNYRLAIEHIRLNNYRLKGSYSPRDTLSVDLWRLESRVLRAGRFEETRDLVELFLVTVVTAKTRDRAPSVHTNTDTDYVSKI